MGYISFIYFSHIFPGLWEISEKFLRIFFDGNGRNGRNGRMVTVVTEIQNVRTGGHHPGGAHAALQQAHSRLNL